MLLHARPSRPDDLDLLTELLRRASERDEEGIGYPRCDDADELLAELDLYGLRLEQAMSILETPDSEPVGAFGHLHAPDLDLAYLIGPLLRPERRDPRAMSAALALAVGAAPTGVKLRCSVVPANHLLTDALVARGWIPTVRNLEMVLEFAGPCADDLPHVPTDISVARLDPGDPRFAAAAALIGRAHRWSGDCAARLRDHVEADGYRVAVVGDGDQIRSAAAWVHLEGTSFSRLEYLASDEAWRGRGFAAALVRESLRDARARGSERVFLSVGPDNAAARRLYARCGFRDGVTSVIYEPGGPSR